ncbi:hypothetical protein K438DRAFT_1837697, partial [Mycena galopus ATCC 62051]
MCVSCLCLCLSLFFSSFAYHFLFPCGLLLLRLLLLFSLNPIPYSCLAHPVMPYVVESEDNQPRKTCSVQQNQGEGCIKSESRPKSEGRTR